MHWSAMKIRYTIALSALLLILLVEPFNADKECAARQIPGQSVVCVCNDTYCDDITRDPPQRGSFVSYTSSQAGSRFKKAKGILTSCYIQDNYPLVLELNTSRIFQTCEGFGGAVTDSAAINWSSLSQRAQDYLIDSYFSERGLEYNMMRVPIGGTDFSLYPYAYNDHPQYDAKLTNYTLSEFDTLYKIPMIKAAKAVATAPIHIVSTTWSPPAWMKGDYAFSDCGILYPQYYQTYADYHLKFIEKYAARGVDIWAITTTNEPSNGLGTFIHFNCLGWTPDKMGYWIQNNLGPTIRGSKYKDVKILCCDDQRPNIPFWFNVMTELYPKTLDYIDGVAVHFYDDATTNPVYLTATAESHPDKFILGTEACEGFDGSGVILGSWERAKDYALDILQDLNHYVVGWIDWNLCLDTRGGPNWISNFVDSPVLVDAAAGQFYKQPTFYALGHFSKFLPRGSRRIAVNPSHVNSTVSNVAFTTTRNTVVTVLYNDGPATTVALRLSGKEAMVPLEAHSVCTVEMPYCCPGTDNIKVRAKSIEITVKKPVMIEYDWGSITVT